MRVYVSSAAKRAVVVKEDDLPTKADIAAHPKEVIAALYTELQIWLDNRFFEMYVYKWKFVKAGTENVKTISLRLILRGFMDTEAFD
eukprot:5707650-Pyramimonas_sp.AAC.1